MRRNAEVTSRASDTCRSSQRKEVKKRPEGWRNYEDDTQEGTESDQLTST